MSDGISVSGRAVLALCSAWIVVHPPARATVFVSKFGKHRHRGRFEQPVQRQKRRYVPNQGSGAISACWNPAGLF